MFPFQTPYETLLHGSWSECPDQWLVLRCCQLPHNILQHSSWCPDTDPAQCHTGHWTLWTLLTLDTLDTLDTWTIYRSTLIGKTEKTPNTVVDVFSETRGVEGCVDMCRYVCTDLSPPRHGHLPPPHFLTDHWLTPRRAATRTRTTQAETLRAINILSYQKHFYCPQTEHLTKIPIKLNLCVLVKSNK